MQVRIEFLTLRFDPAHAVFLERLEQIAFDQLDALVERLAGLVGVLLPVFAGRFEGALNEEVP
jgi:hypothetical protein